MTAPSKRPTPAASSSIIIIIITYANSFSDLI